MKISCSKEVLEYAFTTAERFTGKNLNLPILSNILIDTDSDTSEVVATNLEYAIQIKFPGKIHKKGKVSVPAKILSQLIQSVREDRVDLEEKQGNLIVKTDTREVRINGVPSEDFPLVPKVKSLASFRVSSILLSEGLARALPAVSTSEFKPELNGVYFKVSPVGLTLAATDTFRLAESVVELQDKLSSSEATSFILPWRVSQELVRILNRGEENVKISLGEGQIIFEFGDTRVVSRLTEGLFPEYGTIIPGGFKTSCFLPRDDLLGAIRSSSIFSSKLQEVTFDFGGKSVDIVSQNQEVGTNRITLPCSITGESLKISFNYRFVMDGLSVLKGEEVFLGCNEESTPVLIRDKVDSKFIYVVMPIRLT